MNLIHKDRLEFGQHFLQRLECRWMDRGTHNVVRFFEIFVPPAQTLYTPRFHLFVVLVRQILTPRQEKDRSFRGQTFQKADQDESLSASCWSLNNPSMILQGLIDKIWLVVMKGNWVETFGEPTIEKLIVNRRFGPLDRFALVLDGVWDFRDGECGFDFGQEARKENAALFIEEPSPTVPPLSPVRGIVVIPLWPGSKSGTKFEFDICVVGDQPAINILYSNYGHRRMVRK